MYEPHLGLCIIHDLHQTTKRWWALHSGKLSPPWTQACLLNMSIDSNFYVLKETPMKLWSCTLALHWFSSDLRYFLGSAWGFSNWKCFCLAFLLLRTACWNGTHLNGPQTLCTCLWRPCNHSSLHAARPTVLPINGGETLLRTLTPCWHEPTQRRAQISYRVKKSAKGSHPTREKSPYALPGPSQN